MAVVWVTLVIGLGAMLGMAALVIDAGYGMGQVRAMQNGADAGAMAAARLLAGSVVPSGGGVAFMVSNGAVHAKADEYAGYNRPASMAQLDFSQVLALLRPAVAYAQTGTTTMTVVCNPNPTAPGSPTTCTATLDGGTNPFPTGTVTFSDSSGTGTFSSTTCTLTQQGNSTKSRCSVTYTPTQLGSDAITATYSGDGTYAPNSSSTSLSVNPPTPTPTPTNTPTPGPTPTPTLPPTNTPLPTPTAPPRASYPIAVQYLDCSSNPAPTPNFTAESDLDLVLEINQSLTGSAVDTRQASPGDVVPAPPSVCAIRVFARVIHPAGFATTLGANTMTETARTTARISGAAQPTEFTNIWPITRWICNGADERVQDSDGCDADIDANGDLAAGEPEVPCYLQGIDVANPIPCVFWDSNSYPQGSFKHYVDMSYYSGLARNNPPSVMNRENHLNGWGLGNVNPPTYLPDPPGVRVPDRTTSPRVDYDQTHPGSSGTDRITDIPHWVRSGWKGMLRIDHTDPTCNPTAAETDVVTPRPYAAPNCANSRLETLREVQGQGNLGNNIKGAARDYIDLHKAGNSQTDGSNLCRLQDGTILTGADADYADVTVFFWRYGEQDLESGDPDYTVANSLDVHDQSKIWRTHILDAEGKLKRLIAHRAANFRFCRGLVGPQGNGAAILGYFVAFVDVSQPPTNNPPNAISNTVSLTE